MSATVISSLLLNLFICLEAWWNLYLCLGPSTGPEKDRPLLDSGKAWEPFLRKHFIRSLFLAATCNQSDISIMSENVTQCDTTNTTSFRHILFL